MRQSKTFNRTFLLAAALALMVFGCSDNRRIANSATGGSRGDSDPRGASLSVGFRVSSSTDSGPGNVTPSGSVEITSATIVIGRIRFITASGSGHELRIDDPLVIDLDLSGATQNFGVQFIPPGVYEETRYRIEKLQDNDSAVYADNPDMQDISIRVEGLIDGDEAKPFTWTAHFMEDQVEKFEPMTVFEGDFIDLVFELDQSGWFVDEDGHLLDPRLAETDGKINSEIEHNVKGSFKLILE